MNHASKIITTVTNLTVIVGAGLTAGCRRTPSPETNATDTGATPVVCTVNYPLQYFADRIGGDLVDVRFPAPADGDPAFWRPDPAAIATFQSAGLILRNGADYAKWIRQAALPRSRMVDTSASFADRLIAVDEPATHAHGPEGEHAHTGTAFTTWIDFELAIAQARAVHDALAALRPDSRETLADNLASLEADLNQLDAQMVAIGKALDGAPLVASHPIYQYWARRYGLAVTSVQWEPETVPDDAAMTTLSGILADHPAKTMIWEGPPDPRSAERLAIIGVSSVVFDPCANVPAEGDFLSVMRANVANLSDLASLARLVP